MHVIPLVNLVSFNSIFLYDLQLGADTEVERVRLYDFANSYCHRFTKPAILFEKEPTYRGYIYYEHVHSYIIIVGYHTNGN